MGAVPRDKVGAASGMTLTIARIGGAMGIAVSGALRTDALGASGLTPVQIESPQSWAAVPETFLSALALRRTW